jgi:hypothetical protein
MGKNDKKSGDKGGGKGKGAEGKESGGKAKGAMSINVRHILVRHERKMICDGLTPQPHSLVILCGDAIGLSNICREQGEELTTRKCEKHSKKEEALAKLSEGVKFDEVARTYSEDKARQGIILTPYEIPPSHLLTSFVCSCRWFSWLEDKGEPGSYV